MRYRNFYACYKCPHFWDSEWDSMCDDECPACGARNCTPIHSREIADHFDNVLSHWGIFSPIADDSDGDWQYYSPGLPSASTLTRDEANQVANAISAIPALIGALQVVIPDLEKYAARCGPGPDKRLTQARAALTVARIKANTH